MTEHTESRILAWFDRHFDIRMPFTRFARNMILISLAGLLPLLGLYVGMTPGFGPHLIGMDSALERLIRQILTNGLPVIFVINTLSVVLFAQLRRHAIHPGAVLALDFAARTLLFAALHAVIYFASALIFGSFGGDPVQALRVVGPTLAQAAAFGNLSGVYLYATLVSALPLQMAVAEIWCHGRGYRPSSRAIPVLFALAVIAAQILVLTVGAMAVS